MTISSVQNACLTIASVIAVTLLGVAAGGLANFKLIYLIAMVVAIVAVVLFFQQFERTVLGLLILRSSLDAFSDQQLPSIFAIGVDLLVLLYVVVRLLKRQSVQTDGFFWFLAAWVGLQGMWVVLSGLGALGSGSSLMMVGLREWIRVFSGLMVYLLVMQLRNRLPAQKLISTLFLSLIVPLLAATLQMTVPPSMLPSFLVFQSGFSIEAGSRMNGTLGHPNAFATFSLFFLGLTLWKMPQVRNRLPWLLLAAALAFFLVSTKSLTGLVMLVAFIPAYLAPRLNIFNLVGGLGLAIVVVILFANSELGQERLTSLYGTPLLNPDIDVSRAILLHWNDGNSFNWRIAQWTFLLEAWQKAPLLGHGLDTSRFLTPLASYAHNDYVRFLAEEGIIGFILFLLLIGVLFLRLTQLAVAVPPRSPKRNLCLIMMAILSSMLVGMIAGNVWNHTALFFYWWSLMAVLGWNWELPAAESEAEAIEVQPTIEHVPKRRSRLRPTSQV